MRVVFGIRVDYAAGSERLPICSRYYWLSRFLPALRLLLTALIIQGMHLLMLRT